MDQWKDIPGKFDIQLNRKTYLYNVINKDDVKSLEFIKLLGGVQRNEPYS